MNRAALLAAVALAGCAGRENMGQVRPGMTGAQVEAALGGPPMAWQPSQAQEGAVCGSWNLYRPFFERGPGAYTDRYFVCLRDDRVVSSGRAGDAF